jgi:hypothetical protein
MIESWFKNNLMKKNTLVFLFVLLFINAFAQNNSKWSDLFSYNNVLAFKENNGKIIAATENGVFYYDTTSGEIKKLSKANGLHEVKISAFDYNPETNVAIIGYQSGNLDVVTDDAITYVVDIPLSQSYTGSKSINNISINGDKAVISVGYGVSIFNVNRKEFGDTCFFFNGSTYEKVLEATIKDDVVYAVTGSSLKYHPLDVTFSVYTSWSSVAGAYTQIDSKDILALATNTNVYYGNVGGFVAIPQSFTKVKDVRLKNSNIVIADLNKVYVYNTSGVLQKTVDISEEVNTANIIGNTVYTGTQFSGIYDENKNSYKPDGPYSNISYKVNLLGNQIWVATGGREEYNTPTYTNLGYYHYDGTKWNYPDYFKTSTFQWNILDVKPNPVKPTEVYFTNYSFFSGQKGIYKMENNSFVKAYLQEPSVPYNNRVVGLTFDEQNNLLCSAGFFNTPNQPTAGFYYYNIATDSFTKVPVASTYRSNDVFTKDGVLYAPSPYENGGGLIVYNYNNTLSQMGDDASKVINKTSGTPEDGIISAVIDKNDDLWLGGFTGLRVLPGASSILTTQNPKAEPIVITQNNIPEELFKDLKIISIDVDSGNQKWVSVEGGGVFYLSSNGENTIQHFTKLNSPLPDDTVTDVKVDQKTGKVYFSTYDGIVVYQGDVINVSADFGNVKVYPNPVVTAQYKGNVKITGLAEKTNIRITDAAGNLVHQNVAKGGYYEWNLNNQRGVRVASGIYFVLMTNEDGTDKATAKIAVVN